MKLAMVLSTHAAQFEAVAFKEDFASNVQRIADLGYDGVELAVRDPALVDVARVQEVLAAHRLAVPAIGTGQAYGEEGLSFTDPDAAVRRRAIERIKAHIAFAAQFDALVILGLIRGTLQSGVSRAQAEDWLAEALVVCADVAAAQGVRLVLEPINRYETSLLTTVGEALQMIERVGRDNLGILFDTFHANIEEPSITGSLQAAGDRLFHVHLADSNRWYPGAGHTDFAQIVATLRAMGYDGWLSAEILPKPDPETAARETIRHMRQVLQEVG